jgi:magnesium transporter
MDGVTYTRVYSKGELLKDDFPLDEVSDYLEEPDTVVWVDLCRPSAELLHALADELSLHELAVEDVLEAHQRPKVDHYATHLFLSCHAVALDADSGVLTKVEVDAFVSARWIVTVRKSDRFGIDEVRARMDRSPDLCAQGVGFLLYCVLDVVVDGYFTTVEQFDEFYDQVSDGIFAEHPLAPAQQRHWFQMRQSLVQFHRLVVPLREAVSSLMRRERNVLSETMYPYYQDVYDHVLRASESSDSLRDLVSTIVETNLALRDAQRNEIMKKVTSWAAIIAVPTLITGYYGMNVPYPGFDAKWGFWLSVVLIVAFSGGLYIVFKKKDWL